MSNNKNKKDNHTIMFSVNFFFNRSITRIVAAGIKIKSYTKA